MNKAKGRRQRVKKIGYQLQKARTEKNKTKKVMRHFKKNPEDMAAWAYLKAKGVKEGGVALVSKGRRLKARASA